MGVQAKFMSKNANLRSQISRIGKICNWSSPFLSLLFFSFSFFFFYPFFLLSSFRSPFPPFFLPLFLPLSPSPLISPSLPPPLFPSFSSFSPFLSLFLFFPSFPFLFWPVCITCTVYLFSRYILPANRVNFLTLYKYLTTLVQMLRLVVKSPCVRTTPSPGLPPAAALALPIRSLVKTVRTGEALSFHLSGGGRGGRVAMGDGGMETELRGSAALLLNITGVFLI